MKNLFNKVLIVIFFLFVYNTYNCKGQIIYASLVNSGLIKIDLATCSESIIGYTDSVLVDIAFCSDHKLYGTDWKFLYEIDTSNAAITTIGQMNLIALGNNLVCDNAGNLLSVNNDSLYQINRYNGQYVSLGFINYYSAGDLTFYNDTLYLAAYNNYLIKISFPNIITGNIGTMNATNIFGINTVCFNNSEKMIATGGTSTHSDIYEVNPNNATLNLICNSVTHNLIYGAASVDDINFGYKCNQTFVLPVDSVVDRISLFPNPTDDIINFETNNNSKYEVILYDITMKKLNQIKFERFVSIDISSRSKGIYFYEIKSKGILKRGKIIKN